MTQTVEAWRFEGDQLFFNQVYNKTTEQQRRQLMSLWLEPEPMTTADMKYLNDRWGEIESIIDDTGLNWPRYEEWCGRCRADFHARITKMVNYFQNYGCKDPRGI